MRRRVAAAGLQGGVLVALLLLVALATQGLLLAVAAVGMAGLTALVVTLGLTRAGTALIGLAMFTAPLNDLRLGGSQVTASDIIFVLGIGVLTPTLVRQRFAPPWTFVVGVVIVLSSGAVASASSEIPFVSASQLIRLVAGAFLLPAFFIFWRPPLQLLARLGAAYVVGATLSVFLGVVRGPVAGDFGRYAGFTTHPNYFALGCLLAIALLPFVLPMTSPSYRWMLVVCGLVNGYGVWISGSRAALLVLIVLVIVYTLVERSLQVAGMMFVALTFVVALSDRLLRSGGDNALGRLFGGGSASGSDQERETILREALSTFQERPVLGSGFDGGLGSHNIYLQIAVAVGVIGLVGYLLVLWSGLRPIFLSGIGHRLAYPMIAYATIGPLTNTLWDRLIWAAVSLVFALDYTSSRREDETSRANPADEARDVALQRGTP